MSSFSKAKHDFDSGPGSRKVLPHAPVPVDGKQKDNIAIRRADGAPLEELYKWQFVYALINSGLYPRDHVAVEVRFPKGNKASQPLKLDLAVFDSPDWIDRYDLYWKHRRTEDLEWLNSHLIAVGEFKKNEKEIDKVFTGQVKPAMREKDPATAYVLGVYYDAERLFLFHRCNGLFLRYDASKNQKGDSSKIGDLSLHLPDPYSFIPSLEALRNRVHKPSTVNRSQRGIRDLDVITSIATVQIQDALSRVLRTLEKHGLVNQRGYEILIQTFALKIFDEKCNERNPKKHLQFFIEPDEAGFKKLHEKPIQQFIERMQVIWEDATTRYENILSRAVIDWKSPDHVRAVVAACENFQDFSFVRSSQSDLYQLVYHNFATKFQQQEKAQFLTPQAVIGFLVQIVNPRDNETVFDPCCGIGDFLSLSYVSAQAKPDNWKLDDANIFGADVSGDMITLASLNMLLNGDGNAHLYRVPDLGSILWKIKTANPPEPVELIPERHRGGKWDDWPDKTRLMKFDVILTNPPFGKDRAFRPSSDFERRLAETYETWFLSGGGDSLDKGVVFLENAFHCLKVEGRLGIVVSNSIASNNEWQKVREWLMDRMRIVALFDLPANVFAETGANTSLIVAYKPEPKELKRLNQQGYSVFVRDIQNVGYEKRTAKRNVFFNPRYKINETTFEVETDAEGRPILDEDFMKAVAHFRQWARGQEGTLQRLFLNES